MVTKAALVLLLLGVTLAQVYDDYPEDGGDYEEELMDVAFPLERFSEFITCLCMGLSSECTAHYSISGSTMTIEQIEKTGDLTTENTHCKYYSCTHVADSQKITCAQIQQKSSACETGTIAQFFQHREHKCCGLTCVGLFWANIGESLNLKQNMSDIVPCESPCLCPTLSPGGYTMTKLSPTSSSDSTEIGTYLINKTSVLSSNGSTPTKLTPESIPTEIIDEDIIEPIYYDDRTTLRTLDISSLNDKTSKSWRSPSSEKDNNERDKIITIAVVVTVVVLITVCVVIGLIFIRRRQRRSRRMTLNAHLQGGRGPNFNSDPELLHTIHRSETDTAPKLTPSHKPEVESAPKFYTKLKHENSFTIGKNGYRNSHNLSNNGGGRSDRNSHARESVTDRNSHARGSVSPVTGEPDGKITIVDNSRINGDAAESSQPLLTFPSSRESEV